MYFWYKDICVSNYDSIAPKKLFLTLKPVLNSVNYCTSSLVPNVKKSTILEINWKNTYISESFKHSQYAVCTMITMVTRKIKIKMIKLSI